MRKPQEVERFGLPFSLACSILGRMTPKLNEPRLLRVQRQSVLRESLMEGFKDSLRILPVLKA